MAAKLVGPDTLVGQTLVNRDDLEYLVLEQAGVDKNNLRRYKVRFKSGYEVITIRGSVRNGKIRDLGTPREYGPDHPNDLLGITFINGTGARFVTTGFSGRNKAGILTHHVKFESGWETDSTRDHILSGKIMDKSAFQIGARHLTTKGWPYTVTGRVHTGLYSIKFDSGFETEATTASIRSGKIRDRLSPTHGSIGCLGSADPIDNKVEYQKWTSMIHKCRTSESITVCPRWRIFSNFIADLPMVNGYNLVSTGHLRLTLAPGATEYSLETCLLKP